MPLPPARAPVPAGFAAGFAAGVAAGSPNSPSSPISPTSAGLAGSPAGDNSGGHTAGGNVAGCGGPACGANTAGDGLSPAAGGALAAMWNDPRQAQQDKEEGNGNQREVRNDRKLQRSSSCASNFQGKQMVPTPNRNLRTDLKDAELRGAPLAEALMHFGVHWRATGKNGAGDASHTVDRCYHHSQQVDQLDDFISHEWRTGRWPKFACLCLVYNGHPALVASIVVTWIATLIQAFLPHSLAFLNISDRDVMTLMGTAYPIETTVHFQALGFVVFTLVFLFGQRIRQAARKRPIMVFVDKLCINQTDPQLKASGIASLAGFLRNSKRLLVLWTPRYLTRLWCVYELATWIHFEQDELRTTYFIPVSLAPGILILSVATLLVYLTFTAVAASQVVPNTTTSLFGVILLVTLLTVAPTLHKLRRLVHDLAQMDRQLGQFSVRHSKCFCCSHGHLDPVSRQTLSCDRLQVYRTLRLWFGMLTSVTSHTNLAELESVAGEEHLDAFDLCVKEEFRPKVLLSARPERLDYRYALMMAVPYLWYAADRLVCVRRLWAEAGAPTALIYVLMHLTYGFAFLPSLFQVTWRLAFQFDRRFGLPSKTLSDFVLTSMLTVATFLCCMALWFPLAQGSASGNVATVLCILVAESLLTVLLFTECFGCPHRRPR